MPLPSPNSGESRDKFVSRCVSILSARGEGKSNEQRVAICINQFGKSVVNKMINELRKQNQNV